MMNQKPVEHFSVAILAGGQSQRMKRNKALMHLGGAPVLQWVINAVKDLAAELFLVTNTPETYKSFNVSMTSDIIPGKAALGGIYTAIAQARHDWVLVLACDMPLLNPTVITFLTEYLIDVDVVSPLIANYPETLHTFYHKNCLSAIEKRIKADRLKVIGFFEEVKVHYVSKQALRTVTSDFNFLTNLNTPDDFRRIEGIIEKSKPHKF